MKKIICYICMLGLLCACIPYGVSLAEDLEIAVNESFENYPTNGNAENFTVKSGFDARVVERAKGDKAFYAKAERISVSVDVPLSDVFDKTVFSYDLKIAGSAVAGSAMKLSGGTSRTLLSYNKDGSVTLEDGMRINPGNRSGWNTYTFCVDYKNKLYDMYINGKRQFENRKFYSAPSKNKNMGFEFTCTEETGIAEIYFDNIRVYEGDTPLPGSKFPKKTYNTEVLPFEKQDTAERTYDTVFVDSNSNNDIGSLTFYQKAGTIAQWQPMEENGPKLIYFKKDGATNDCFADLAVTGLYDGLTKYVYQTDIYIEENESTIIGARADGGEGMSNLIYIDNSGGYTVQGVRVATVPYGTWVNLAVAVDIQKGVCSAYLDRKLVADGIEIKGNAYPSKIRMGFVSDSNPKDASVYFNKIKIYDGLALRTFSDSNTEATGTDAYLAKLSHTDNESDDQAKSLLGNDVVFMTRSGKFYAHGEKYDYSNYGAPAYMSDDAVMVDAKVFTHATDIELSENGGSVLLNGKMITSENKDGVLFINAAEAARAAGKSVYDTDNREFIVVSSSNKGYSNGKLSRRNQEDIDVIWRYMQFDRPSSDELYTTLVNSSMYKSHPRLLVKKDEIPSLKSRVEKDGNLRNVLNKVINNCDSYFEKEPQKKTFQTDGFRTFSACYNVKARLFDLCTVYLLTGDTKYADRAWLEMENALNWDDWNLDLHYLDSGEIAPGMAYAYDILYDYLTEEQKQFFRDRIQKLYLDFCVGIYTGESYYNAFDYRHVACNWGAVTGAAMYMMASVLVDEEGEDSLLTHKCKYLMSNVMQTFELLATVAAPEGTWYEGANYYEYVQQHTAWFLEATDNIFGKDYNFISANGLKELTRFIMYTETNKGVYNYSDETGIQPKPIFAPEAFIYAKLTDDKTSMKLYDEFRKIVGAETFLPQYLLFYDPDFVDDTSEQSVPLDCHFNSYGISSVRESWNDPDALYLGVRSGANIGIEHRDKGSFIFETGGVRWSMDVGRNGNDTMDYLRRAETHSTLVINPTAEHQGQTSDEDVPLIARESKDCGAYMVYDMHGAYSDWVESYKRGFLVSDDRQTLTVRDELNLKYDSELIWNLVTKADIEISQDGKSAVLKQDGKTLNVTAVCSLDGWRFEVIDDLAPTGGWAVDQYNYTVQQQKEYTRGVKKLVLKAKGSGNAYIAVKLASADDDVKYAPVEDVKIENWMIPDGKVSPKAQAEAIYADGVLIPGFVPGIKKYNLHKVYGSSVPYFTADCKTGTAEVKQASGLDDYASVTVTMPDGLKAEYRIFFDVEERITDVYIDTKPRLGLPGNLKLLDIANVLSDHEPQPENPAKNVADGDLTTRWSSDQKGSYVEVDLGKVYDLSGLALAFADGETRNYQYEIWISENKMDYKRVYKGYSLGGTLDYEYTPLPVKARYVRYVGFQHTKGIWNSITEVRPVIAE